MPLVYEYITEKSVNYRMNYLRGVLAVLIVLGHCSMNYETEPMILLLIHKSNFISVCFFFFLSGWSLSINYDTKPSYINGFFFKKTFKLFALAVIYKTVEKVLKFFILKENLSMGVSILEGWNWYIYETLIFYVIFQAIYSLNISTKKKAWTITIVISLLLIFAWIVINGDFSSSRRTPWYWSSLSFPLGCLIHQYYSAIKSFYSKVRLTIYPALILFSLCMCSCLLFRGNFFTEVIMHNFLGGGTVLTVFFLLHHIDIRKISLIAPFTKISSEIYFYQFVVLDITKAIFISRGYKIDLLYVVFVLCGTLILATIMHILLSYSFNVVNKRV